jgi:hypothetical protein
VTSVKEEFVAVYRSDPCWGPHAESVVNDFVDSLFKLPVPVSTEDPMVLCRALWNHFHNYRVTKASGLLPAQQATTGNKRSATKKLTGVPAVRLLTLCVLLATRCLEFHNSEALFDLPSFLAAYPEFVAAPDVAGLLTYRNFVAGMRAFQPHKAVVGRSVMICAGLSYGPHVKVDSGKTVPTMNEVAKFSRGTRKVDLVARLKLIFYRETGTAPKPRPARKGANSTGGSGRNGRSNRKRTLRSAVTKGTMLVPTSRDGDSGSSVATTKAEDSSCGENLSSGDSSCSSDSCSDNARAVPASVQVQEECQCTALKLGIGSDDAHFASSGGCESLLCIKRKTASGDADGVSSLGDSSCEFKRRRSDSASSASISSSCMEDASAYDTTRETDLLAGFGVSVHAGVIAVASACDLGEGDDGLDLVDFDGDDLTWAG